MKNECGCTHEANTDELGWWMEVITVRPSWWAKCLRVSTSAMAYSCTQSYHAFTKN